jgi:sugar O-acyltransferase (sialic acid O-acetyltransferase NeuD family)
VARGERPRLLVVGASGHAKVIVDAAERAGIVTVVGFAARDRAAGSELVGYPIVGGDDDFENIAKRHRIDFYVVAVGDNAIRAELVRRIDQAVRGARFATIVHPGAQIASSAELGPGTVVMSGSAVNSDASVGSHCIVNTGASIDHDCRLGDFASVGPGATLGGNVTVGAFSAISLGAKVIHGVNVSEHAVVGAGAVVLKDVPSHCVMVGVPARVLRSRGEGEPYL